jgi:CyaY protein
LRGRRRLRQLERAFLAASSERQRARDGEGGAAKGGYHPGIMNETDFHRAVDAVLARIEAAAEDVPELDVDLEAGILTLTCADGSRIIVNRQTPNREIWVAARSGGFHFSSREGAWRDTRSGDELFASLARVIASQAGVQVDFG